MRDQEKTLAETAFDNIFSLILNGELPFGGVINEVALAQRFNISRGPVREAVQRLQGLKLVTREQHMRARVVQLTDRDIVEIFQLRESVEGMACRLAVEVMPQQTIDELLIALEPRQEPVSSENMLDVHVAIAKGCGNRRIETLLCEDIYHLLRIYRARSGATPGRHDAAYEEHWQIVSAINDRNGRLAESLMRSHIARATQVLLANMNEDAKFVSAAAE